MHRVPAALVLLSLTLLFSCAPKYSRYISQYQFSNNRPDPDYTNLEHWAAHPYKKDPSDSLPLQLQKEYFPDSTVDVFFVHPTTFTDGDDPRINADINEPWLNVRTDYTTILFQASVFNELRVFAPRYRQAHVRAYFMQDTVAARAAFDKAYADVKAAFQYYLDHFNGGRPIIIAGHSQGSTHSIRLLKEFFDGTTLGNRLVVAYIPGMNIPQNIFTSLQPCTDSLQTGCFCGWRTYKKGYEPLVAVPYRESYVTNPLTWTTDETYAPALLNQGGVLRDFDKIHIHVTDAQVHNNFLWVKKPKFRGSLLYRSKNYHIGDINLFYLNIRSNIQTRIRLFWKR